MDFCQMIHIDRRLRLFALLLVAGLLCIPAIVHAEEPQNVSTPEQVAIAFFKAADTNPDFDLWARNTDEYKRKSATRADEFLYEEKQRLMKEWKKYNPDQDLLMVKAVVNLEIKVITDKNGNENYWMYITFRDGHITYFPYVFQEYKIAVIPQKIESLMIQPITKEQYQLMHKDFGDKPLGSAIIYISLKPERAYIHQPYDIDGTQQWALLSNVVSMSLISFKSEGTPYWNYGAPWYVSPHTKELRDLYKSAPSSSMPVTPASP